MPVSVDPLVPLLEPARAPKESLRDARKELDDDVKKIAGVDPSSSTALTQSNRIAMMWGVIGDAYLRDHQLDLAEKYLKAAWAWTGANVLADRLGQLYEQQGKKDRAIRFYCTAIHPVYLFPKSRARLIALAGGEEEAKSLFQQNAKSIAHDKGIYVPLQEGQVFDGANARFQLIFAGEGKVDAKFMSGKSVLQALEPALSSATYPVTFPESIKVALAKQAEMFCSPGIRFCSMTLSPTLGIQR